MDITPETSRWPALFLAGMLLGLIVAVAAGVWHTTAKPTTVWSPEKAAELQAATEAVHAARQMPVPANAASQQTAAAESDDAAVAGLDAAEARFNELNAELEYARTARERWGKWGALAGLGLTILCGLGYLATREQ